MAIAQVLSFARRLLSGAWLDEVKVDGGGGVQTKTAQQYGPPGDDSQPLASDFAVLVEADGAGEMAIAGYHETKLERKAGPGEARRISRSAVGELVSEVWQKTDGTVVVKTYGPGAKVIIDCEDIRVGDEEASQPIARVGDLVVGSVKVLCTAPGSPALPIGAVPTASGGIPFAAQIVSGALKSKAK